MATNEQHSSSVFREEQMTRYRMNKTELSIALHEENKKKPKKLFGERLDQTVDVERITKSSRFGNELIALRIYFRSLIVVNQLSPNTKQETMANVKRTPHKETIRIKRTRKHEPVHSKVDTLIDIIDIGKRLEFMCKDNLELLVDYYILKKPSQEIADERCYDMPQLGGKISAARRELRKILGELIKPAIEVKPKNVSASENIRISDQDLRRMKAIAFVRKRMKRNRPEA